MASPKITCPNTIALACYFKNGGFLRKLEKLR